MRSHAKAPSGGFAVQEAESTPAVGRKGRGLFGLVCLCVLGLAAFLGSSAPSAPAAEAFPGQGFLPDNRAWEMVSPPEKSGGEVEIQQTRTHAAADCASECAVTYLSRSGFGDAQGTGVGTEYMAVRDPTSGSNGWVTHGITPPQDPMTFLAVLGGGEGHYVEELSPDLSKGVFRAFSPLTEDPFVDGAINLYARDDLRAPGPGSYELDTACPNCEATETPLPNWDGKEGTKPNAAGHSADFKHILFESVSNLTGNGKGVPKVYQSDEGAVRLVGVVPAGAATTCGGEGPACVLPGQSSGASIAGLGAAGRLVSRALSDDGRTANFSAPVTTGGFIVTFGSASKLSHVYQRDSHGTASTADDTTVKLDASERVVPVSDRYSAYETASTDGSRVFFFSPTALTDEVTPAGAAARLYIWSRDALNDEVQKLTVSATAGQFKLLLGAEETTDLPFDASTTEIETAIEALPAVSGAGGQVTVTGGPGDELGTSPYTITFGGGLAGEDQPTMTTAAGATLLSGGAGTATVAPWSKGGGHLKLVDVDREPADEPNSVEGVFGANEDGSDVYFVARGELVEGKPVPPSFFSPPVLYHWHEGEITYVGRYTGLGDWNDSNLAWGGTGFQWGYGMIESRVTPDGQHLLFAAQNGEGFPTAAFPEGYEHGLECEGNSAPCTEFYAYDAETEELRCATCDPSGTPAAVTTLDSVQIGGTLRTSHQSHSFSDDGRYVFFSTAEALVPEDVNGKIDAYQYDTTTEEISLLSSGFSDTNSYFMDASADGSDVFIITKERLSGWDVDTGYDLYDARVGGGIPEPLPRPPSCEGDACQPPVPSLNDPTPSSSSFEGPGNPSGSNRKPRCPKGKRRVRTRGGKTRCVNQKRRHRRAAKNNRRAGR